jgi:hypothetical protein
MTCRSVPDRSIVVTDSSRSSGVRGTMPMRSDALSAAVARFRDVSRGQFIATCRAIRSAVPLSPDTSNEAQPGEVRYGAAAAL